MKSLLKSTLLIALFIVITMTLSCSKDDSGDDSGTPNSVVEKISTGEWYLENESQKVSTSKCEKQTSYKFKNDENLE